MRTFVSLPALLTLLLVVIPCPGGHLTSDKAAAHWLPPSPGQVNSLGKIVIDTPVAKEKIELPILADPITGTLMVRKAIPAGGGAKAGFDILLGSATAGDVHVTVTPCVSSGRLMVDIESRSAIFRTVRFGSWPAGAGAEAIAVPYYSEKPVFLRPYDMFADAYFDWQNSGATLIHYNNAIYNALTDGKRNPIKERIVVPVSADFAGVLPVLNSPPSPHRDEMAGKMIVDIWGPTGFINIAQELNNLADYGLADCMVVIHDWQRSGFDNALPAHYPASTRFGGGEALRQAVAAGRKAGCLVGLHENYIDYYQNYEGYTAAAVARNTEDHPINAWLNYLKVQSFSTKPGWFVKNALTQSPEIHALYGTNASFLDVNSSVTPWWRVDMDATAPAAGLLSAFRDGSADLWNFERKTHGGPVLGEGKYHWFWSGMLDGVEAQFGAGVPETIGENAPLFVDFDLLTIHPKQVNHGMGYYERWGTLGKDTQRTDLLDAYRMEEIAYGHAPFIGKHFWNNVPRVLIEQNLVTPVAKRYGTQKASRIQYEINGAWTDTKAAIKAQDWSRLQVEYENGDKIVANASKETLTWQGHEIPQYGWIAQGRDLLAYTALKQGLIVDYAETADAYFANARNQVDIGASGMARASVVGAQQTAGRSLALQMQWQVLEESRDNVDLTNFVHFVDAKGTLAFQSEHAPAIPTTQWKPGQLVRDERFSVSIPPGVPDGLYFMNTGLYSKKSGQRFRLAGVNSGENEYPLGELIVSNHGERLTFRPGPSPAAPSDPRMNSKGRVVDFGVLHTDGMVSLNRKGGNWVLRAYPRTRNVTVQLKAERFPGIQSLVCDSPQKPVPAPPATDGFWQVELNGAKSCTWPIGTSAARAHRTFSNHKAASGGA